MKQIQFDYEVGYFDREAEVFFTYCKAEEATHNHPGADAEVIIDHIFRGYKGSQGDMVDMLTKSDEEFKEWCGASKEFVVKQLEDIALDRALESDDNDYARKHSEE